MTHTENSPALISKIWKPMWLASLGLHGLLLVIPIPSTEIPKSAQKPQELVKLTPVTPSPSPASKIVKSTPINKIIKPTPVASSRPLVRQTVVATKPTPRAVVKNSPSPVAAPIPQKPATPVAVNSLPPATDIEIDPKSQELLPLPQAIPSVSPSPVTIATKTINGVPVDPNWQVVEQPNEVMAEAEMFTQPDGKLNPDIVGKAAQIPDKSPDVVFDEFFRLQLAIANFNVEPSGTYAAGGGLYKLIPKDNSSPLYLALAPDKQGTGTVVTIWNKYPSPVEPTDSQVLN